MEHNTGKNKQYIVIFGTKFKYKNKFPFIPAVHVAIVYRNCVRNMAPKPASNKVESEPISANIKDTEDIYRVPENINFPAEEENTLNYWHDNKIFEQCLQQSKGKPK